MARLNSAKKLVPEDFKEDERDFVQRLADVMNPFMYSVFSAISKQLTLDENIKSQVYTVDLLADQTTTTLKWSQNQKPQALLIGNITKDDRTFVTQPASVSWSVNGEELKVAFLGLAASTKHKITLVGLI